MSLIAVHGALRINTNPLDPNLGVIRTINLAIDDPDNFGASQHWNRIQWRHVMIPSYLVTESAAQATTRVRRTKGIGLQMLWSLEADFFTVNQLADPSAGEMDIQELMNALSIGMTGTNDGVSNYLWFTPNLNWNEPAEQWFLVTPTAGVKLEPRERGTAGLKLELITSRNYKKINWTYYRKGGLFAGAGTVTTTFASPLVTGAGGTRFKRDFIKGDLIYTSANVLIGEILSVQSDTALTLKANAANGAAAGIAYIINQRSAPSFNVPVYTFTEYATASGWGKSSWGDNWGR